ncbi:MFS transporter [Thermotoga neapolitana]|uniref:Major facilitator superfamily MFS_1 n=1 Tax=Thermotoga neapolitana (strain ATCC 49049 / DSM 4359 / NBRC 107923 / NS-E) TaxID=309803 RepID=B9K8J3_THENN|nr:MFS transporter [Thermotoga neapolitana]ACM23276.1 Major facilitator superfamily MFS_1 precursor [Thermotoga neapolitana DSM 4359]KFZ21617.1 Major facilitator superfamily MFS_1 precursor [Thermotoga neapolitana LA10]
MNRNLLLFASGSFVSLIGTRIYQVALAWWLYSKTGSSEYVGLFMISSFLPAIIVSPFAGTVVDRHSRRNMMVVMDILRGVLFMYLFLMEYFSELTMALLLIVTVLVSVFDSFFNPAVDSLLPDLVRKENLVRANSLYRLLKNLSKILGPALGSLLLKVVGLAGVILINSLSFLISGIFEMFIKVEEKHLKKVSKERKMWQDIRSALLYIRSVRFILVTILVIAIMNFFTGSMHVLLPEHVSKLGKSEWVYGTLMSMLSFGGLIVTFLMATIKTRASVKTLGLNLVGYGLAVFVFAMTGNHWLMFAMYFLIGIFQTLFNINVITLLQLAIPEEMRGKIFSLISAVSFSLLPVSYGFFGFLSSYVATAHIFITTSMALIAGGVLISLQRFEG